jgi:histidyl-tRNA synthetase
VIYGKIFNEKNIMKNVIKSVKGTRDFYPQEMALRTWLYSKVREVSESFGYQEFEGPLLESIDLYAAKSGEELVKEQSFVFPDRGGDMLTLRPELTPTLVRMVAQKQRQLTYPLRWWSFGPFWRYERPQKGRTREFFQWNIDLIGIATPEADAELVAIMAILFQSLGLTPKEAKVSVNNRRLIDSELSALGFTQDEKPQINRLIDRKGKMKSQVWENYGLELGLTEKQLVGVQSLLADMDLWKKSEELVRFFKAIDVLGVGEYIQFDPEVIRGLDYYTGTVYEGKALTPEIRRSIAGGGRYDNLLADVGGDPTPGTGFAMGDMVITLLLEKYNCVPDYLEASPASVLVTIFDEDRLLDSYKLAADLREAGLKVATYPTAEKLGKQFKYADRIGAKVAVILGPDELKSGQVAIKNLKTRGQENYSRENVIQSITDMLA